MILNLSDAASWRPSRLRSIVLFCLVSLLAACSQAPVSPEQPKPVPADPTPAPAPKPQPEPPVTTGPSTLHTPVELYVSAQGSDSARGDIEHPLATLNRALELVRPGGTIYLRAGRYPAFEISRAARADAWVTLTGYPHERVVIEAGESDDFAVQLNSAGGEPLYWKLRGLDIRGGKQAVVAVEGAQVHLLGNHIHQSAGDLVRVGAAADEVVISGNQFDAADGAGVRLRSAVRPWLASNYFSAIKGAAVIAEKSTADLLVERNLAEHAGVGLQISASGGVVRNNVIVDAGECLQAKAVIGLDVLHNSCVNSAETAAITLDLRGNSGSLRLLNNLIALPTPASRALSLLGSRPAGRTLEIDGNLYWHPEGEKKLQFAWAAAGLERVSFDRWQRDGLDIHGKFGKPQFAPAGYAPVDGSAAIGVGLRDIGVSEDYRGLPRDDRPVAGAVAQGVELPLERKVRRDKLQRYPYLQSHRADSASIAWAVAEGMGHSRVRVHDMQGRLIAEAIPEPHDLTPDTTLLDFSLRQYRARFDGLQPDTEYVFSIVADGDRVVRGLPFKTLPVAGARRVNFVAFGDSGTDYDQPTRVRDRVTERKPDGSFAYPHDLVMGVGDLAYYKGNFKDFRKRFFGQMTGWNDDKLQNSLITHRPFHSSLGNHEYNNNEQNLPEAYLTAFDYPLQSGIPDKDAERYYSFDSGPVHFVVIDTMKTAGGDLDATRFWAMRDWIEQDLNSSQQPWKIAFFHHSPLSFGPHGTWGDQTENTVIRKHLLRMMQDLGVQMVMFGHDHMYQRTVPLRLDERGKIERDASGQIIGEGGVTYVAVGNGGADIHNRQTQPSTYGSDLWNKQRSDWGLGFDFLARLPDGQPVLYDNIDEDKDGPLLPKRRWGFAHVRVDGDKLDLTAYNFFGEVMDDFSLTRGR